MRDFGIFASGTGAGTKALEVVGVKVCRFGGGSREQQFSQAKSIVHLSYRFTQALVCVVQFFHTAFNHPLPQVVLTRTASSNSPYMVPLRRLFR